MLVCRKILPPFVGAGVLDRPVVVCSREVQEAFPYYYQIEVTPPRKLYKIWICAFREYRIFHRKTLLPPWADFDPVEQECS